MGKSQMHNIESSLIVMKTFPSQDKLNWLNDILSEYSEHNFSEFVFSWYMKEGKQSRLLASTGSSKELGR